MNPETIVALQDIRNGRVRTVSSIDALFDDVRSKKRWKPNTKQKFDFSQALKAERQYAIQLRRIVRHVYNIVHGAWHYSIAATLQIKDMLARYSALIRPWAEAATRRMHTEVAARNLAQWEKYAKVMGVEIERDIRSAPVGEALRVALQNQVHLITRIPRDIAERVHELTMKGLIEGTRAEDVREMILEAVKGLAKWKATLIARTETARTASLYTEVRAKAVGSTHYIWRSMHDARTRPSHRRLDGMVCEWSDPPLSDPPDYHSHPGCIWNCRCYAEPLI
jgi:SPP1 gp7 family putative phage head morphogenesis protein